MKFKPFCTFSKPILYRSKEYILILLKTYTFILLLSTNCSNENDPFTIKQVEYTGNALRLDGYYYLTNLSPSSHIYVLYRNGVILDGISSKQPDIESRERELTSKQFHESSVNYGRFGLFIIDSPTIRFETKHQLHGDLHNLWQYSGSILNESTFVVTEYVRVDGEYRTTSNDIYHFKYLSPKPDSTCPNLQ